jgi:hypothetical protein
MKGWSLVLTTSSTVGSMPRRGGGTAVSAVVSSKYSFHTRFSSSVRDLGASGYSTFAAVLAARRAWPDAQ